MSVLMLSTLTIKINTDVASLLWLLAAVALVILSIVACWRVFRKAKQPGWASLIPVYNAYVLLKIVGRPAWWLLLYILPLVNVIVHIVVSVDLAKAFRKSAAFGFFGLFLFPFIGYLVLGFGSAKYKNTNKPQATSFKGAVVCLLAILLITCVGVAGWAAWNYWQEHRIKTAQETINAKFKNIELKSDSYQDEFFQAYVTYVVSENAVINQDIRKVVDARFGPCKAAAERNTSAVTYDCHASPEINFATDAYLEVTYSFRQYPGSHFAKEADVRQVGLLYDRKTGKRLGIADLFKPGAQFAQALSDASRAALHARFDAAYYKAGTSQEAMMRGTTPNSENFNDFLLTGDEKLTLIFEPGEVAPEAEGVVQIELAADGLYDLFNQATIDVFLPKLKEQKEAEQKLAEEAADARQRAQELVGENRENIDCTKMKCIALTYDDGPYAPYGNRLLDILKERNAVTTFFMVGNRVAAYAPELKRVVDQQSEIGNHSWDHSDLTTLSDADVASQVQRTSQAVYNASGVYPKLMRPPYGAVNARVIAQINMPLAFWSVDTLDWKYRDADTVYQNAIAGARPGAVILMHEIHGTTIDAAPRIIDELQRQNYVLVTVSEMFGITKDNLPGFVGRRLSHD